MAETEVSSEIVQKLEIITSLLKDIREDQHEMLVVALSQHPHRYLRQIAYTWLAGGKYQGKISDEFLEEIDGKAPFYRQPEKES